MNTYTKQIIKDGKLEIIQVEEKPIHKMSILNDTNTIFKVTHIGAHNQIKITDGQKTYHCNNPFRRYCGTLRDSRLDNEELSTDHVAMCDDKTVALNVLNMKFDLSPEEMSNLFYDVYYKRENNECWVEL